MDNFKSVREVNETCSAACYGRNRGRNVYAKVSGLVVRVIKARTTKGQFQVKTSSGQWLDSTLDGVYTQ